MQSRTLLTELNVFKPANIKSPSIALHIVVAQGSILGPNNYSMHTKSVDKISKRDNIKYHCYADDTQVCMTLKSCDKWDDI